MIKLSTPIASFWTGPADGEPVRVVVDRFKVMRIDTDFSSGTVTFSGVHGYMDNGEFKAFAREGGALYILSKTLLRGETFESFLDTIKAAGAPRGNFRVSDIEQEILAQGLVSGVIEA